MDSLDKFKRNLKCFKRASYDRGMLEFDFKTKENSLLNLLEKEIIEMFENSHNDFLSAKSKAEDYRKSADILNVRLENVCDYLESVGLTQKQINDIMLLDDEKI